MTVTVFERNVNGNNGDGSTINTYAINGNRAQPESTDSGRLDKHLQ
ncbi:hypothetical protein [Paenibacillus oryzisoli]|nr:hypothetical protein [Paenibacillus oryzisoli]